MQKKKLLVVFMRIVPVHSKFYIELGKDDVFIVQKLTKDDAAPPESPLLAPPHFI